jgi:cephalosporin-C deacetylase
MSLPVQHPFAFDPTGGLSPAALAALRPPPAPAGFDAFWAARYAQARAVDPAPRLGARPVRRGDWLVHDLRYTSTDGVAIGGWLLRPARGPVRRGLVVGHGYGGRDGPDLDLPVANTVVLFPCVRGFGRSALPGVSADPQHHIVTGIDRPDSFIIGGCVADLWVAVSALLGLHPELGGTVAYSGVSLGGGLGALAMAQDARIGRGALEVPTFGNMKLWLDLPSVGSAAAAQAHVAAHPAARDTLALFDAAVAATRIRVPTLVAAALFDPAVSPPTQWSIANARTDTAGHETFVLDGMDAQHRALAARLGRFLAAPP